MNVGLSFEGRVDLARVYDYAILKLFKLLLGKFDHLPLNKATMTSLSFTLHPQLAADTLVVGNLNLCQVLLMNESRYPWFILVPQRAKISEIYQLTNTERAQVWEESDLLSRQLMQLFQADKLNIAALGNLVPQLHIHHIARFKTDAAWPAPVWGKFKPDAYTPAAAEQLIQTMRQALGLVLNSPSPA